MWCLSFVKTLSIQYYCDCRSCSLPRRLLCVRQYPLQETMNVETLRAELAGQLANIFHVVKVSGAVVCVLILSSSAVWCKVSAREWLLSPVRPHCQCASLSPGQIININQKCLRKWQVRINVFQDWLLLKAEKEIWKLRVCFSQNIP